jgi:methyl-accepting chemotaxis protein
MQLSIRSKVVLLCVVPVLLFALIICALSATLLHKYTEEQVNDTRSMLIAARKTDLKHAVQVAQAAITPIYEASGYGDKSSRDYAVSLLKRLQYGVDGYFFGYDTKSVRVFWSDKDIKIGDSFRDFQDPNGLYVINELVGAAQDGTHFKNYMFALPNSDKLASKIGYTVYLEKWDLVIGAAVNVDDIEAQVSDISEMLTTRSQRLIRLIMALSAGAFFFLAVAAAWQVKNLLMPLREIRNRLDDISDGEGDLTHRLPIIRNDEIGQLSVSFNRFVVKIHSLVSHVVGVTGQLNSLVGEVSAQSQRLETAMNQQRLETDQIAAAVNEMSTTALQVAHSAQDAVQAADAAEIEGQQASRVVNESVDNIYGLVENLEVSETSLDQLQKEVNDIGGVVVVIRSIADQTNLLALNAAIEAARAGDAGRGFAVVADEVRALASRTQISTEEIQSMIRRLQLGTTDTVSAMQLSSTAGIASREQAAHATTSLSNIAKLIGTITSMNAQIASAAHQQTTVSDEVNRSIHQIAIAVDEVARDTRKGAETARELAIASQSLHVAVSRFRI